MLRKPLLLAMLVASCSKGPDADLASIGEARSLTAEWALVNEQALRGQLNTTYADTMRKQLRKQLQTTASSLTQPNSSYAREIGAVLAEPDNASPQALRGHADRLKQVEAGLESA
jgi:hypothetical protein